VRRQRRAAGSAIESHALRTRGEHIARGIGTLNDHRGLVDSHQEVVGLLRHRRQSGGYGVGSRCAAQQHPGAGRHAVHLAQRHAAILCSAHHIGTERAGERGEVERLGAAQRRQPRGTNGDRCRHAVDGHVLYGHVVAAEPQVEIGCRRRGTYGIYRAAANLGHRVAVGVIKVAREHGDGLRGLAREAYLDTLVVFQIEHREEVWPPVVLGVALTVDAVLKGCHTVGAQPEAVAELGSIDHAAREPSVERVGGIRCHDVIEQRHLARCTLGSVLHGRVAREIHATCRRGPPAEGIALGRFHGVVGGRCRVGHGHVGHAIAHVWRLVVSRLLPLRAHAIDVVGEQAGHTVVGGYGGGEDIERARVGPVPENHLLTPVAEDVAREAGRALGVVTRLAVADSI